MEAHQTKKEAEQRRQEQEQREFSGMIIDIFEERLREARRLRDSERSRSQANWKKDGF
jgi:hypothetical protein